MVGGGLLRITRAATTGLAARPNVPGLRPGQQRQPGGAGGKMKRKVGWRQQLSVAGQTGSWRHGAASQSAHHWRQPLLSLLLHQAPPPGSKALTECILAAAWSRARNCAASPAPRRQPWNAARDFCLRKVDRNGGGAEIWWRCPHLGPPLCPISPPGPARCLRCRQPCRNSHLQFPMHPTALHCARVCWCRPELRSWFAVDAGAM